VAIQRFPDPPHWGSPDERQRRGCELRREAEAEWPQERIVGSEPKAPCSPTWSGGPRSPTRTRRGSRRPHSRRPRRDPFAARECSSLSPLSFTAHRCSTQPLDGEWGGGATGTEGFTAGGCRTEPGASGGVGGGPYRGRGDGVGRVWRTCCSRWDENRTIGAGGMAGRCWVDLSPPGNGSRAVTHGATFVRVVGRQVPEGCRAAGRPPVADARPTCAPIGEEGLGSPRRGE